MKLKAEISAIIDELDNFHLELLNSDHGLSEEQYQLNFVTSKTDFSDTLAKKL